MERMSAFVWLWCFCLFIFSIAKACKFCFCGFFIFCCCFEFCIPQSHLYSTSSLMLIWATCRYCPMFVNADWAVLAFVFHSRESSMGGLSRLLLNKRAKIIYRWCKDHFIVLWCCLLKPIVHERKKFSRQSSSTLLAFFIFLFLQLSSSCSIHIFFWVSIRFEADVFFFWLTHADERIDRASERVREPTNTELRRIMIAFSFSSRALIYFICCPVAVTLAMERFIISNWFSFHFVFLFQLKCPTDDAAVESRADRPRSAHGAFVMHTNQWHRTARMTGVLQHLHLATQAAMATSCGNRTNECVVIFSFFSVTVALSHSSCNDTQKLKFDSWYCCCAPFSPHHARTQIFSMHKYFSNHFGCDYFSWMACGPMISSVCLIFFSPWQKKWKS